MIVGGAAARAYRPAQPYLSKFSRVTHTSRHEGTGCPFDVPKPAHGSRHSQVPATSVGAVLGIACIAASDDSPCVFTRFALPDW